MIAGQFQPTKNGVLELIKQYNISQDTLRQAMQKLNSPAVSGVLNMVKPGLTNTINDAANEIIQSNFTPNNVGNNTNSSSFNTDSGMDDLRKRLAKM